MAVVSKLFSRDMVQYATWKREVDYFINRLVGGNRFVSCSVYEKPSPPNRTQVVAYVWFREAEDETIEEEFPDLAKLTYLDDAAVKSVPELADANSLPPLTLEDLE